METFFENRNCKAVCDIHVKSRIDPCISHHGRGSKLLLVLPRLCGLHGTEKAKFWVIMLYLFALDGDIYIQNDEYLSLGV